MGHLLTREVGHPLTREVEHPLTREVGHPLIGRSETFTNGEWDIQVQGGTQGFIRFTNLRLHQTAEVAWDAAGVAAVFSYAVLVAVASSCAGSVAASASPSSIDGEQQQQPPLP